MEAPSPRQVGRLRIEWQAPPDDTPRDEAYRSSARGALVLERVAERGPGRQRRMPVVIVISVVNTLLLGFAAYVRSWPAVGAVSFAIVALLWLVTFLGRDRGADESVRVVVDDEGLRGPEVDLPIASLRTAGAGLGPGGSKTVWVGASSGRALVFDELSEAEADAAMSALQEAIARRRPTASSEPPEPSAPAIPAEETVAAPAPSKGWAIAGIGLGAAAFFSGMALLFLDAGRGAAPGVALLLVGVFATVRNALRFVRASEVSARGGDR